MGFTEVFVSTHDEALKRAAALDGGAAAAPGAVRIADITDFEVERLGDLAGTAVHASGADYELAMVDVASDSLLGVPPAMVRALAELLTYETEGEEVRPGRRRRKLGRRRGHALRCGAGRPLRPAARRTGHRRRSRQQIRPLRLDFLTPGHSPTKWTGCGCQVEIPPLIWHNKQVLDLRGPSLRVRILSF